MASMSAPEHSSTNAAFFDQLYAGPAAAEYTFDRRSMSWKDRGIVRALDEFGVAGKRCLDVGPGTGRWLKFLHERSAAYLAAIDSSEAAARRCQQTCPAIDKIQLAELEDTPFDFASDSFDIVLSIGVLEHIRHPENYLSEMRRVIKAQGLLLLSTDNIASLASRIRMIFGIMPVTFCDPTHVRFFRRREVTELLERHGMTPEFINTSVSLLPHSAKSKLRLRTNRLTASLEDFILWKVQIQK
jgi:2-polyprenyl-3-methyl-5-hydroxy-6-metoxy-1,4-benzoquinol methylase